MRSSMIIAFSALSACVAEPPVAETPPEVSESESTEAFEAAPVSASERQNADPVANPDIARFAPIDEVLYIAAYRQLLANSPPLDDRPTVCLAAGYVVGRNTQYDPTPAMLAAVSAADHRWLPASQCGFTVRPFALDDGALATLFSVWIRQRTENTALLVLTRTYGNLGGEAFEAEARRTPSGWEVSTPVLRSVS